MPNEPERDIEKTLKACADKRREQAPAPAPMHPATRKMLQGEVAKLRKLAPQPHVPGFWEKLWGGSWPRFAIRFAVAAVVLALAAALILPEFSNSKQKKDLAMVRQQDRELASANRSRSKDTESGVAHKGEAESPTEAFAPPVALDRREAPAMGPLKKDMADGGIVSSDVPPKDKSVAAERSTAIYALKTAPAGQPGGAGAGVKEPAASTPPPASDSTVTKTWTAGSVVSTNSITRNDSGNSRSSAGKIDGYDFAGGEATARTSTIAPASAPVVPLSDQSLNTASASTAATGVNLGYPIEPPPSNYIEMVRRSNAQSAKLAFNEPAPVAVAGGNFGGMAPAQNNTFADSFDTLSGEVSQRFVRAAQPAIANRKLRAVNKAVFNAFKIEQNGQAIRVIDGDGSIYLGQLGLSGEEKAKTETYTVAPFNGALAGARAEQQKQLSVVTNRFYFDNNGQSSQGYFFRVNGTNRSLRQLVDFSGSLIPLAQANSWGGPSLDQSKSLGPSSTLSAAATPAPLQWRLLNSQLQGQAIIGGSNKLEIKAVPVKP